LIVYAREEIVAELTSCFLGQELGFTSHTLEVNAAYLNTLIALNVAPAGSAAKLLRRRGRSGDTNDPDRLRDELLDEAQNARRLPSDPDWDTIDNPGIRWGGPIKEQGGPWEDHLERLGDLPPKRTTPVAANLSSSISSLHLNGAARPCADQRGSNRACATPRARAHLDGLAGVERSWTWGSPL